MIKDKMTYRWLWGCLFAGSLVLTGCSDRSEEDLVDPDNTLQLMSLTRTNGATELIGTVGTDIKAFLTSADEMLQDDGKFQYTGIGWDSNLSVKEERQYYLYGYMPATITGTTVEYSEPAGGYSEGIDLTFSNLPDITDDDICLIVGVQRVDGTGTTTANVTEGNYSYLSGIRGKNYVNLLMGHLYSGLELNFLLNATYAQVRSIHLKTITLTSTYGKVNATVNIRNGRGIYQPSFTQASSATNEATFLDTETVLDNQYTVTPLAINQLVYCAPSIFDINGKYLTLTSVYDVYDKNGNNLGERTSENKLRITASSLGPGQKKTVVITVKPTYLYVLSDGDLDNPEFEIN